MNQAGLLQRPSLLQPLIGLNAMKNNPYHPGELCVQDRANQSTAAHRLSQMISAQIPATAIEFIAQQPMVVIGSVSDNHAVSASILVGNPGFLQALNASTLVLDVSHPRSAADDPLWENIQRNPEVGLLVIDLLSRRRLRLNGRIRRGVDPLFLIDLDAVYVNCPKYIQRRHWRPRASPLTVAEPSRGGVELEASHLDWITQADTFFVTSANPGYGVDASHRGGHPGFVQVLNTRLLMIPDYSGNNMFNTLGNFVSYPHAGLVFVDFARGRLLQLSGSPEIIGEMDSAQEDTGGAQRYWQLQINSWRESALPLHLEWEFLDYSRFNPQINHT